MKVPRALQRTWADKLKASGFQDLEVGNGELLSNRGTIEAPRADRPGLHERRQARAAYLEQAKAFLASHRFVALQIATHKGSSANVTVPATACRRIWELHANGMGAHVISTSVRLPYQQVRGVLVHLSRPVAQGRKGWRNWTTGKPVSTQKLRSAVKRCDPRILMSLALAISNNYLTRRMRGSSSTSASVSWGATSTASTARRR